MRFRVLHATNGKLIVVDYSSLPEITLSTGMFDRDGVEIFEGDIIAEGGVQREVTRTSYPTDTARVSVIGNRYEGVRDRGSR